MNEGVVREHSDVPLAKTQITTVQSLYGAMPHNIRPDARRSPGDDEILVDRRGLSPARLSLYVILFGVVLK